MKHTLTTLLIAALLVLSACASGDAAKLSKDANTDLTADKDVALDQLAAAENPKAAEVAQVPPIKEVPLVPPPSDPPLNDTPPVNETTQEYTGRLSIVGDELFSFNDYLWDIKSEFTDDDFPGYIESLDDGDFAGNYPYTQKFIPQNALGYFAQDDDYDEYPLGILDLQDYQEYQILFDDHAEFSFASWHGDMDVFGHTFTYIRPDSDDLEFLVDSSSFMVDYGTPLLLSVDGQEYTIEILSGDNITQEVNIRIISEDDAETKTLGQGDISNIAGLTIYIDEMFFNPIGDQIISLAFRVGFDYWVLPQEAISPTEHFEYFEINDEWTTMSVWVEGTSAEFVQSIHFRVHAEDLLDEDINDEWDWLTADHLVSDPYLGWGLYLENDYFDEITDFPAMIFESIGGDIEVEYLNGEGDAAQFVLFSLVDGKITSNLRRGVTQVQEDDLFLVRKPSDGQDVIEVWELTDVDSDYAVVKNLHTSDSLFVGIGGDVETLSVIDISDGVVTFDDATELYFVAGGYADGPTANGLVFGPSYTQPSTLVRGSFVEPSTNVGEAPVSELQVEFRVVGNEIKMFPGSWSHGIDAADGEGMYDFHASQYGTLVADGFDGDVLFAFYHYKEFRFNVDLIYNALGIDRPPEFDVFSVELDYCDADDHECIINYEYAVSDDFGLSYISQGYHSGNGGGGSYLHLDGPLSYNRSGTWTIGHPGEHYMVVSAGDTAFQSTSKFSETFVITGEDLGYTGDGNNVTSLNTFTYAERYYFPDYGMAYQDYINPSVSAFASGDEEFYGSYDLVCYQGVWPTWKSIGFNGMAHFNKYLSYGYRTDMSLWITNIVSENPLFCNFWMDYEDGLGDFDQVGESWTFNEMGRTFPDIDVFELYYSPVSEQFILFLVASNEYGVGYVDISVEVESADGEDSYFEWDAYENGTLINYTEEFNGADPERVDVNVNIDPGYGMSSRLKYYYEFNLRQAPVEMTLNGEKVTVIKGVPVKGLTKEEIEAQMEKVAQERISPSFLN